MIPFLAAASAAAASAAFSADLVSPREFQVFQRGAGGAGDVRVEGTCPDGVAALGASVVTAIGAAPSWTALALEDVPGPTQRFRGVVKLPGGGWYALSVARAPGEAPLAEVARFGVGEVFLVAGQSNSTNFGEERTAGTDERVAAFDGEGWWIANDPMPGVQDGSQGGSPWPTCGKLLRDALGVPVAFASCGFGGTRLAQWQKGAPPVAEDVRLYDGLVARAKALGAFRAVLWHQGESDAGGGTTAEQYVERFEALRRDLAADAGIDAPWIVAHVSFVPGLEPAKMEAVRRGQTELWKRGSALQGPDTDDLLGPMRHSRDKIHFSREGLVVHGTRWFAHVWAACFADPPLR